MFRATDVYGNAVVIDPRAVTFIKVDVPQTIFGQSVCQVLVVVGAGPPTWLLLAAADAATLSAAVL
jgi:hypothetical protein